MTHLDEELIEISFVGDLTEHVTELSEKLLSVPRGGDCTLYFDSPGGSPYTAISLMNLIKLRNLNAVGIVAGECSSAALWPFAACRRRFVTPYSVLLFHPMRWQSEEHVGLGEAAEWARHFGELEIEMDNLLANLFETPLSQLNEWSHPGRYIFGRDFAKTGLAELIEYDWPAKKWASPSPAVSDNYKKVRRRKKVHSKSKAVG